MKKIYCCLTCVVLTVALNACGKNEPESAKSLYVKSLYTNCVSTKNQKACEEVIHEIKALPPDKAKMHLWKLCNKYDIEQACEP